MITVSAPAAGAGNILAPINLEFMAYCNKTYNEKSLSLVLNYACNNNCVFCFVGPERKRGARGLSMGAIDRIFAYNAKRKIYKKLVLSGEPTLRPDLSAIATGALRKGGFECVHLQTNARKLADKKYCKSILSSGISEYLVSVHAATPAVNAAVTGCREGLQQTRKGVRNLLAGGTKVVSNTVVSALNYRALPKIASMLLKDGVRFFTFWAFFDNGVPGQAKCNVRFPLSVPFLLEALDILNRAGVCISVSGFPKCMLGKAADLTSNYLDDVVIAQSSFTRRMKQGEKSRCFYCDCADSGVNCFAFERKAYSDMFGDEREFLTPA